MTAPFIKRIVKEIREPGSIQVLEVFGLRMIAVAIGIGVSIVLARLLGPEQKGIATSALVLPLLLASVSGFGIPVANVYFLHRTSNRGALFANGMLIMTVISVVGLAGCLAFMDVLKRSYFSSIQDDWVIYVALCALPLALYRVLLVQFLRGLERYRVATLSKLIFELVRVGLLMALLVPVGIHVASAIVIAVGAIACVDLYVLIMVLWSLKGERLRPDRKQLGPCIRYGLREYVGNLLTTVNIKIDLVVLALFLVRSEYGIYAVAVGLGEMFQYLPNAVSFVLLPRLTKRMDLGRQRRTVSKCIRYDLAVLVPCWLLFLAVGRPLVKLAYGPAFEAAYRLGGILMIGFLCLSVVNIVNKFFSAIGRPGIKSVARAWNIPIKIGLLLTFCLRWGTMGAAAAFAASSLSLLLLTLVFYGKRSMRPER